MNKRILFFTSIVILATLVSACGGLAGSPSITSAVAASEDGSERIRTLNVSGTGRVTLTPDIAYITIGVQTESKDAAQAVSENNTKTQAVINALKDAGVESKDIKTTNFNIYPRQEYDDRGKPTGEITYIVNNSVFVTVRALEGIGELLNATVAAGANTIQGIQFDVDDKAEALADAQAKAVENARAQANNLAEAAGVTLGDVLNISTLGVPVPLPKYEGRVVIEAAEAAPVPISPGEMVVSVEVNMVFEIK